MPTKVSQAPCLCYNVFTTKMKYPACTKWLPLTAAAMLMVAAGCNRAGVKVYKADSSDTMATTPPPVAATSPSGMPATMPPGLAVPDNSSLPKLKYALPDGWTEKAPTQMRVASFDVSENGKTADVSVIPLGAMSVGDTANVNRWRGQVGQAPADETAVKNSAEPVQVAGKSADLYDVSGADANSGAGERIIAAILHTDDTTWFFKMMGDAVLVEQNKAAFVAFLKSVQFQQSQLAAAPPMDMSQLPAGHPAIPGMAMGTQAPAGDKPSWTVPSGWKEGELTQFLVARYIIQGSDGASAVVNVSQLDGDGGGLLPNLNRWHAQLGQPPMTDDDAAKLPTINASGVKAVIADFSGTDARAGKPAQLVGVVLPLNGQTWFYKLMGDPDLVAQEKGSFIAFVQSAKYPAAK
jgi:hypothetical protein